MVFGDVFPELVIKVFVDSFKFADDHNYLNKKVRTQVFEVPNVLMVDFGPVQVGEVENMHGIFPDQLDEQDSTVLLLEVS